MLSFYETGAKDGGFESGIGLALQVILASPHFVFRLEEAPRPLDSASTYQLADLDLASRLSFFLWARGPDAELLDIARAGGLQDADTLQLQVERMLVDPKSEALATRFASQLLRLQDLDKIHPDVLLFPGFETVALLMNLGSENSNACVSC